MANMIASRTNLWVRGQIQDFNTGSMARTWTQNMQLVHFINGSSINKAYKVMKYVI